MRGMKIVAIAVGVIVAFLLVSSVTHFILHLAFDLIIAALVIGGVAVAIKMARSGKEVSGGRKDREIRDDYTRTRPRPTADIEQFTSPGPAAPSQPAYRPAKQDVDDELARLKREMES
jgi:hypothetical protein